MHLLVEFRKQVKKIMEEKLKILKDFRDKRYKDIADSLVLKFIHDKDVTNCYFIIMIDVEYLVEQIKKKHGNSNNVQTSLIKEEISLLKENLKDIDKYFRDLYESIIVGVSEYKTLNEEYEEASSVDIKSKIKHRMDLHEHYKKIKKYSKKIIDNIIEASTDDKQLESLQNLIESKREEVKYYLNSILPEDNKIESIKLVCIPTSFEPPNKFKVDITKVVYDKNGVDYSPSEASKNYICINNNDKDILALMYLCYNKLDFSIEVSCFLDDEKEHLYHPLSISHDIPEKLLKDLCNVFNSSHISYVQDKLFEI